MIGRVVEIAQDGRHLSADRGFMVVSEEGKEVGRVALDDIAAVIANAHGISYSNNLLAALAERNALLVIVAANHSPVAFLWSLEGNYQQAGRMDAQLDASKPLNKKLWADIVKAKLTQQASVLEALGLSPIPVKALISDVRSGDPQNIEAQAARRYWPLVFGNDFRRDRDADGANAQLNYGYTVLRAATARAILAAGLHPSLGLHHSNQQNAMRLADDLMEPFRPLVDLRVHQLQKSGITTVVPDSKRQLAQLLYEDAETAAGRTPVMNCIQNLATSLMQIYVGERDRLELPLASLPLQMQAQPAATLD